MSAISVLFSRVNRFPSSLRLAMFAVTMMFASNALLVTGLDEELGVRLPSVYAGTIPLQTIVLGILFCLVWILSDNFTRLDPDYEWVVRVYVWGCLLGSSFVLFTLGVFTITLLIVPLTVVLAFSLAKGILRQLLSQR